MPFVTDQQDRVPLAGVANRLEVHLRHQRASGVDRSQAPLAGHAANLGRDAVRRIEQRRPLGHFFQVVDENSPLFAKSIDDVFVVNDLVIDVDGRAVHLDRQLEAFDRHVDAGTEAARGGEDDSHGWPLEGTLS